MNSFKEMLKRCFRKDYLSWGEAEHTLNQAEDFESLEVY